MGLISGLSTETFSYETTSHILLPVFRWLFPGASPGTLTLLHVGIRKGMHVVEFGILACLWYRALAWQGQASQMKAALAALALTFGVAIADEAHQTVVPRRSGTLIDVGWDSLGAALGLVGGRVIWGEGNRAREKRPTSEKFSRNVGRT